MYPTTVTTTNTTTTTTASRPITTLTAQNASPTMKLKDLDVGSNDSFEMPNPLVRAGERAVGSLKTLFFMTFDERWRTLYHILTDVSDIPYGPSGNEFMSGLETVVTKNKHRFQALRALRDEMVPLAEDKETTARARVFLDLFNLLLEMESPSIEDPHVALICNFESAKTICKQLEAMLGSTESASTPSWKAADDD